MVIGQVISPVAYMDFLFTGHMIMIWSHFEISIESVIKIGRCGRCIDRIAIRRAIKQFAMDTLHH